jgi:hypothetical protein
VESRRATAAITAIADHMPVVRSMSEAATRTGAPPGSPVMLMSPENAWMRGS